MAAGAVAMMAEAAEERDDIAVVAAVVTGHGAGWLSGWSRHLFSRRTGLDSPTPWCMICKFVLAPHRSRFSYTSYDVSFCIIIIDRTEEQEETRRIRRKRHRYLYCPFCMPSAILNIRNIFFFTYVHSSASSQKSKQVSNQARKKAAGEKTTNTHSVTTFCLHLSLWLYLCDVSGRIWLERQATDCFCKETNIRTETERGAIQEEEEGREEVWRL
jgi:hypothetical protein